MDNSQPQSFRQAFIETNIGTFSTTIPENIETDQHGTIPNPQLVFAVGSIVVLVEKHESPPGEEIVVEQPPGSIGRDEPQVFVETPQYGTYRIEGFLADGRVEIDGPLSSFF
jgi:hypothetical protein